MANNKLSFQIGLESPPLSGDCKTKGEKCFTVMKKAELPDIDRIKHRRLSNCCQSQLPIKNYGFSGNNELKCKRGAALPRLENAPLKNPVKHKNAGATKTESLRHEILSEHASLPYFNVLSSNLTTKISQRMKCKWCYKQCQFVNAKECSDCMARRCKLSPKPTKTDPCSNPKYDATKSEESEIETDCKKVKLTQWDSTLENSHRINQEIRLVENLPGLENSRKERMAAMRKDVSVIIVGAGMAGLSAADALFSYGFTNVIVLEASNRIGGRIHTDKSFGSSPTDLVELGVAEVDYPTEWNTVFSMARRLVDDCGTYTLTKARRGETSKPVLPCNASLRCLDREACYYDTMINQEIDTIKRLKSLNESGENHDNIQLSSNNYFRETLRRIDVHTEQRNTVATFICPRVKAAVEAYCKEVKFQHGDESGDADIRGFHTCQTYSHLSFAYGMTHALVQPLTKRFKHDTLKLNAKVKKIDWSNFVAGTPSMRNRTERGSVDVTCTDGRTFKCNHLILAVPLGFLKSKVDSLFHPSLPDDKLASIDRLGFGSVCKAFLRYENPVTVKGFYMSLMPGTNNMVLDPLIETSIVNITSKPDSCVIQVTFSNSKPEKMKDEDIVNNITCIVETSLRKTMPKPVKFTKTTWKTNSLYEGTHPYTKVSGNDNDIAILARPIITGSKIPILFAGDATHEDYTCLLHAARASGLREAKRLKQVYDDRCGLKNSNMGKHNAPQRYYSENMLSKPI